MRFVATSASRDAANAAEFVDGVRTAFAAYGIAPEVVTGTRRRRCRSAAPPAGLQARGVDGPYLVVDLGGGLHGVRPRHPRRRAARSVDIGCVRMTERHLHSDPPTAAEIAAATVDVDAAIDRGVHAVRLRGVWTLVGLAGTVTTITAQALRLPAYDPPASTWP